MTQLEKSVVAIVGALVVAGIAYFGNATMDAGRRVAVLETKVVVLEGAGNVPKQLAELSGEMTALKVEIQGLRRDLDNRSLPTGTGHSR